MLYGPNSPEVKNLIDHLKHNPKGRDSSWFDLDNKEIIGWSIIPNIAYSCMQVFGNDVRMLTRCYIEPEARGGDLAGQATVVSGELTSVFQMIKEQFYYAKLMGFNHAFISTEYNRKNVIKKHAKVAKTFGFKVEILEGKYKTCDGDKTHCAQNIGLYRLSDRKFGLYRVE